MPRFIGSKFGDFVGIQTVSGFCDSGVYNYNDQVFLNEAGAWQGFSATGGLESTPGNGYKYHTFLSSGSFVVSGTTHPTGMEVLVVAGGGGGGACGAAGNGGGGAGGLRVQGGPAVAGPTGSHGPATPLTIPVGSTTITVGEGGAAGVNGGNSSIGSLLVGTGGGSGGGEGGSPFVGSPGGSSGGASNVESSTPTNGNAGGFSPFPEGNNGGRATGATSNEGGGGGGGAGGNGGGATSEGTGGDGGAGLQLPAFNAPLLHPNASPLAPLSGFYAGGGGGGTIRASDGRGEGGSGGGGEGSNTNPTITGLSETGSNGATNSGGGGGGGAIDGRPAIPASYSGGDGIVVIRYLV